MLLTLKDRLPFTRVVAEHRGTKIEISDVLVDTGSATTILAADQMARIGIMPEPTDALHIIRGVGGIEAVFTRQLECIEVDQQRVEIFEIEVGGMDYGFEINGILGMDFFLQTGAIINLHDLSIEFASGPANTAQ